MKNVKSLSDFSLNENTSSVELPGKTGWYWVLFKGYPKDDPKPCWFNYSEDHDDCYFLPGGMGDSSSMGVYLEDIAKVGPDIVEPKF